jgi:hypothetical protein
VEIGDYGCEIGDDLGANEPTDILIGLSVGAQVAAVADGNRTTRRLWSSRIVTVPWSGRARADSSTSRWRMAAGARTR